MISKSLGVFSAFIFLISNYCTLLVLCQSDDGPNSITSIKVRAFATGATTIQIVWWPQDSLLVERYFVACSVFSFKENTNVVEQNVTEFDENATNTVAFNQLTPLTKYTCCVVEHHVDNATFEACTNVITKILNLRENINSLSAAVGTSTTVLIFVMLFVALVSLVILVIVIVKQRRDGVKILTWFAIDNAGSKSMSKENDNDSEQDEQDAITTADSEVAEEDRYSLPSFQITECAAYNKTLSENVIAQCDAEDLDEETNPVHIYDTITEL